MVAKKNWSLTDRVDRRGALPWATMWHLEKAPRVQCVEDFCPVPRGGCDKKAERACV